MRLSGFLERSITFRSINFLELHINYQHKTVFGQTYWVKFMIFLTFFGQRMRRKRECKWTDSYAQNRPFNAIHGEN